MDLTGGAQSPEQMQVFSLARLPNMSRYEQAGNAGLCFRRLWDATGREECLKACAVSLYTDNNPSERVLFSCGASGI